MIHDNRQRLFDIVLVWKLDRFARNRYDSANYKNILKKNGVRVVSANEPISDRSEGILLESVLENSIFAWRRIDPKTKKELLVVLNMTPVDRFDYTLGLPGPFAEYFSADLAEKVSRGMTENALKCKFNGGNPTIGFTSDKEQNILIDPVKAPFVLDVFKMYDEGATMAKIRDFLNENNVLNNRGHSHTVNSVANILKNRRYIGEYSYRDIVIPNGIPAIISQDLFDRVQVKIEKNRKAPARAKATVEYILTTKLFCGHCGVSMCGESGKGRSGKNYHYYKCASVKKKLRDCNKKSIQKEVIEEYVIRHTMAMLADDQAIEAIVATLMDLQERENINLPLYEQQLRDVERNINNLLDAIQQGIFTKSTKDRLDELEAAKADLEIRIANEKIAKPKLAEEHIKHFLYRFRALDMSKKKNIKLLIDLFINRIYLYDDKLVITYNHQDGAKTITPEDVETTLAEAECGLDMNSTAVPKNKRGL